MHRASRENQYTEFESYNEIHVDGTKLYSWQYNQLRIVSKGLNAKIWNETARDEGVPCVVIEERDLIIVLCKRDSPMTKSASSGRISTLSSNHTMGCLREEPRYILGNGIS